MGRFSTGFYVLATAVGINFAAQAQQADTSPLGMATTLVTLSVFNPQRLIDDPPMANPTPSERAAWQIIRPCLQKIRAGYEAQLPALAKQLQLIQDQLGPKRSQGTAADQAWKDATAFIRAMNISELAITDGANLSASPDFQMNKRLMDQLKVVLEQWARNNPNAPNFMAQTIEKQISLSVGVYRELLRTQCQLS